MEKTTTDHAAISENMSKLKRLERVGNDLLEYWERILPGVPVTTEDYHAWAGDPDFIYRKYREVQLRSMTPIVFDHLPLEARRPELDDPMPQHNPLAVTRMGAAGTTYSGPVKPKFHPGRYEKVCRLAGMAKSVRDEHPVIVTHRWLRVEKGRVVIPKIAKDKLVKHFTHEYTDEQLKVAKATEQILAGIQKVHELTGGRLPITTKGGKVELDQAALKKL